MIQRGKSQIKFDSNGAGFFGWVGQSMASLAHSDL